MAAVVAVAALAQTRATVWKAPHGARDERVVGLAEMAEEHADPALPEENDALVSVATPSRRDMSVKIHYVRLRSRDSDAPVLVLLHGDSSSTHEFDELFPHLRSRFETFAFDQPNSGRSGDVARDTLRALYPGDAYRSFEGLFFLRDVVDAFVRFVVVAATGGKPLTIAGGSLGGNIGLLLAEHAPAYTWLREVFVWSPGLVWTDGGNKPIAAGVARRRADHVWRMPDELDGFLDSMFCRPAVDIAEVVKAPPMPWFWDWDCWAASPADDCQTAGNGCECHSQPRLDCGAAAYPRMTRAKARRIEQSYMTLKSSTTAIRAQWHYEIFAEQVELSHWSVAVDGRARYERIDRSTTFMAGREDRFWPGALYQATQTLFGAAARRASPEVSIRGRWLEQTGHSIQTERPTVLAKLLAREVP